MAKPDLCHDRARNDIQPSWSRPDVYLNAEHEKIWQMTEPIGGWQLPGDSYKLYEMAFYCGDVILEIGTYSGKSAVIEILGSRANANRKRTAWFGVDLDPAAIRRTQATLDQWKLGRYATLFHGDTRAFFKERRVSPTMVFVDGDHRYEGVKQDIEVLSEVLAPEVPVLFHDYRNPENKDGRYGVERACNEWEQTGHVKCLGTFGCSALFVTVTGRPRPKSFWETVKASWTRASARERAQGAVS